MSGTADLKKQLKAAIASYHKAKENAETIEAKLREAKKAEAEATFSGFSNTWVGRP